MRFKRGLVGLDQIAVAGFGEADIVARLLQIGMGRDDLLARSGDELHSGCRAVHRLLANDRGKADVEPRERQGGIEFGDPRCREIECLLGCEESVGDGAGDSLTLGTHDFPFPAFVEKTGLWLDNDKRLP